MATPGYAAGVTCSGSEELDEQVITAGLAKTFATVVVQPELDSTNSHARTLLTEARLPLLVACESQPAGRGRWQRSWLSAPGHSLTFTVAIALEDRAAAGLSLTVATAIADYLAELGCPIRLKWPNDLLTPDGRKFGGILVEIAAKEPVALIGIGLNLHEFAGLLETVPTASWVFAHIHPHERNALLCNLSKAIVTAVANWNQQGWASCKNAWLAHSAYVIGDVLEVSCGNEERQQLQFAGIGDRGQLLATDPAGINHEIDSGEISHAASH